MTLRQSALRLVYPLFVAFRRKTAKEKILFNHKKVPACSSFYDLCATMNDGSELRFSTLQGKKVLIVNTASLCGYTAQYDELQQLQKQFRESLVVMAFPANDFKEQEPGSDEEIAAFCKINYGISFPVAKKSSVMKGQNQTAVFHWLSRSKANGWCDEGPRWNFTKYLIDEQGNLTHCFPSFVSPLSAAVISAVKASS